MFKKPRKLALQNPRGFCDSSSSLVGDSESISSSSVTVVSDSEVNSSLPVNASPGNLPVTVANAPDSAPSSRSASLVFNSAAHRNIKLPKASIVEKWKKKHEWLVITERNTLILMFVFPKRTKYFSKIHHRQ